MLRISQPNLEQEQAISTTNNLVNNRSACDFDWCIGTKPPCMHQILSGLFLGSYLAVEDPYKKYLLTNGITYIICVQEDMESISYLRPELNDPRLVYLTLNIADKNTQNIMRFFPEVRDFINGAFAKGASVLIQGNTGMSRCATLGLAYIMEKFRLGAKEAIDYVKLVCPSIHPNEGFLVQLREYEPIYKARQIYARGESSSSNNRKFKRKNEESDDFDSVQPSSNPSFGHNSNNNPQMLYISTQFNLRLFKNR